MFYKVIINDNLIVIGTGNGGEMITKEEYEQIRSMIQTKPTAPNGFDYQLKADLRWELIENPIIDEEISGQELLTMIEEVL